MSGLSREWFLWAFDYAMEEAVRQHGDAGRLAAYDGRKAFERILPDGIVGSLSCDTDGSPEGPDPQGLDGEAATAGASEGGIAQPNSPRKSSP